MVSWPPAPPNQSVYAVYDPKVPPSKQNITQPSSPSNPMPPAASTFAHQVAAGGTINLQGNAPSSYVTPAVEVDTRAVQEVLPKPTGGVIESASRTPMSLKSSLMPGAYAVERDVTQEYGREAQLRSGALANVPGVVDVYSGAVSGFKSGGAREVAAGAQMGFLFDVAARGSAGASNVVVAPLMAYDYSRGLREAGLAGKSPAWFLGRQIPVLLGAAGYEAAVSGGGLAFRKVREYDFNVKAESFERGLVDSSRIYENVPGFGVKTFTGPGVRDVGSVQRTFSGERVSDVNVGRFNGNVNEGFYWTTGGTIEKVKTIKWEGLERDQSILGHNDIKPAFINQFDFTIRDLSKQKALSDFSQGSNRIFSVNKEVRPQFEPRAVTKFTSEIRSERPQSVLKESKGRAVSRNLESMRDFVIEQPRTRLVEPEALAGGRSVEVLGRGLNVGSFLSLGLREKSALQEGFVASVNLRQQEKSRLISASIPKIKQQVKTSLGLAQAVSLRIMQQERFNVGLSLTTQMLSGDGGRGLFRIPRGPRPSILPPGGLSFSLPSLGLGVKKGRGGSFFPKGFKYASSLGAIFQKAVKGRESFKVSGLEVRPFVRGS